MLSIKDIIILLLAVFGMGGAFLHPIIGIVTLIIINHLNPELLIYNLQGVRFEFLMTMVLILAAVIHRKKLSTISVLKQPQYLLFLFLVLVFFLQSPFSLFSKTLAFMYSWQLLKILIFCFLLIKIIDDEKKLKWVVFSYIAGAFYIAFSIQFGTYLGFISSTSQVLPELSEEAFHTELAAIIPVVLIYCLYGNKKEKIIALVILVFIVNHMFVGGRRTPLVALATMALMFTMTKNPLKSKRNIALVVALIGIAGYLSSDKIFKRFSETYVKLEQKPDVADPRMIIWSRALDVILEHPLGIGPGNFELIPDPGYTESSESQPYGTLHGLVTHNTYLQVATDVGIPGLILLLVILFFSYKSLREVRVLSRNQNVRSDTVFIAWGLEIGLAAVVADIFFRNRLYSDTWWWVIALSAVCLKIFKDKVALTDAKTRG